MKNLFYILVIVTMIVMLYSCEKEILGTTANQSTEEPKHQPKDKTKHCIKFNDSNDRDDDQDRVKNILFQSALPDFQTQKVTLVKAEIRDDLMEITYSYGGGCRNHEFDLVCSTFKETNPVNVTVRLLHHRINDPCDQWVTEKQAFNLSPLKKRYSELYEGNCGEIIVNFLEDSDLVSMNSLTYEFCFDEFDLQRAYNSDR